MEEREVGKGDVASGPLAGSAVAWRVHSSTPQVGVGLAAPSHLWLAWSAWSKCVCSSWFYSWGF